MKANYSILCGLCYLIFLSSTAQNGFSDDFSDGDFTTNPPWLGDTLKFQVNPSNQLQLKDSSSSGAAYLCTPSKATLNATWQFYVELDFNPSTSNYAKVYLVSTQQDLSQALDGYFVRIGGQSGTVDDVSLYRQNGNTAVEIIDGIDGTVGLSPKVKIQVSRDSTSQWELKIDTSSLFGGYVSQGTAIDSTLINSNFMGVYCNYTTTRSDKFFFDDFVVSGEVFKDTIKPQLTAIQALDSQRLQLSFSELLRDSTTKILSNYFVNKSIGTPNSINYLGLDSSTLIVHFSPSFQNGASYELSLANIQDRNGNTINSKTHQFNYFISATANFRDVQINEFYPDFTPSNGLPEAEFVELFNASSKIFDLENWQITDGTTSTTLSAARLNPGEYIILCQQSYASDFNSFGKTLGLASLPTLNNGGDLIRLINPNNQHIDELNYGLNWYQDESKEDGGWSVEQINPQSKCLGAANYRASENPIGGTPGQLNSVLNLVPDETPPELIKAVIERADSIRLLFNEALDTSSIQLANYAFSGGNTVSSVSLIESAKQLMIVVAPALDSGKKMTIQVENLKDCSGNLIDTKNFAELLLPQGSNPFDIIINEVLFNPRTGGSDFVELYNRSNKILSLKNYSMAKADGIATKKNITQTEYLVYPNQYVGLTEDIENIASNYQGTKTQNFIEVNDLPSYNDDEGTVTLINSSGNIIDQINYSDDMHFALLNDDEGVSLERINPNRSSDERSNFHSAAESVGFASPGYQNSQFFENTFAPAKVSINPKTFSPDNDGFQDKLSINYTFDSPGYVANISIFDRNGRLIKKLASNELLGNKGNFIWDGISDENQKARIGIYIVFFEAFNIDGEKEIFKLPVVLAGFLD